MNDQSSSPACFSSPGERWSASGGYLSAGRSASDGCASCRISLPEDVTYRTHQSTAKGAFEKGEQPSLRTTEEVHACSDGYLGPEDDNIRLPSASPDSFCSSKSTSSCHTHVLEYVSNSSPAECDSYSSLRRATIRTLSGEQLPRGHISGPLCFGDPIAGYTIAYIFRIGDHHARGRQRYYAFLALAGFDTRRAFEACNILWTFFEQLARNIVETADQVALHVSPIDDSPPHSDYITPISSFLTGRTIDPDGYPRRGAANVRANSIAELLDNENFFCELHMMFVSILQDLGRILGGMRVKPPNNVTRIRSSVAIPNSAQESQPDGEEEVANSPPKIGVKRAASLDGLPRSTPSPRLSCSQNILQQPRQVAV